MSDEAVTTTEAAPEAAAPEAEATETETTEAAPEAPAEPPAPRQRALARKAERDAINAKKRLAAAEAKEAELSAKLERLQQLEAYAESLRNADPLERARLAEIDIAALSKATLEADTPEARQRAIVEEELAKRERQAEEHRNAQMRAHQAQQESEFTDEGKRHGVIGALLKPDDDDGEPVLTERELLAQGYRMAARLNAKLKADGVKRAASNQEILDAIGAKYSRRFAPTERAPEKPAQAKPVNGSATAARGASRPAPRTLQEMNARFRELMGAGDLWQRSTSQQYRTTSRSCTRTCWRSSGTPIGRSSAWSRRRSSSRAKTTRTRCRTRTGRDARRTSSRPARTAARTPTMTSWFCVGGTTGASRSRVRSSPRLRGRAHSSTRSRPRSTGRSRTSATTWRATCSAPARARAASSRRSRLRTRCSS